MASTASARPLAFHGNSALINLIDCSFNSFSVSPHQATSGLVYITEGIAKGLNDVFSPETTSAATYPSWVALCASIGFPVTSPIAKILGINVLR